MGERRVSPRPRDYDADKQADDVTPVDVLMQKINLVLSTHFYQQADNGVWETHTPYVLTLQTDGLGGNLVKKSTPGII